MLRLIPESLPRLNDITIGWGVLLFALAASLATGTLFGLAPAWFTSRVDLTGTLRQEGRGSSGSAQRSRARQILVISELALSLVLMVAACLLLRSFWDLFKVQPGFNPDRVMTIQSWLPGPNDPTLDQYRTAAQEATLLREILRRSRTLPGVEEAAVGDLAALPLGHTHDALEPLLLIRENLATNQGVKDNQAPHISGAIVSPQYFHLLGIPLERGRLFDDHDIEGTPAVAVINQAAARAWWPGQDPLGKRVHLQQAGWTSNDGSTERDAKAGWTTIVGIVADARTESLADAGTPQIYRCALQRPFKDVSILLRGQLDPATIPEQLSREIQTIDPTLPVFHPQTLEDALSDSLSVRRFAMEMVGLFAATALLLAGIGVYGTISYLVSERTRDIGIRIALGAQRSAILRMVLNQGLGLALAGIGVGLAGALLVGHLMAGLLFGVSPYDPVTFLGITAILVLVALVACYLPARRAVRVDPIVALRAD